MVKLVKMRLTPRVKLAIHGWNFELWVTLSTPPDSTNGDFKIKAAGWKTVTASNQV